MYQMSPTFRALRKDLSKKRVKERKVPLNFNAYLSILGMCSNDCQYNRRDTLFWCYKPQEHLTPILNKFIVLPIEKSSFIVFFCKMWCCER